MPVNDNDFIEELAKSMLPFLINIKEAEKPLY